MYMGVILTSMLAILIWICAPHVYGGDPLVVFVVSNVIMCSPCIWG